ncbi:MAG: SagB/ThcOx family dehydrogenase [Deltaproteobacteria bacterium]|nr:SagB/ThcOx family dehydrogenase [Deltaproteobacteria bacterium]MBW2019407.1 SagB/ThcOx family dehydrogenase [Deltaproteobacteria bacterium]MBW2074244.1 SagB/ThcOx family dehydrogenase [Deltaproteobacteria bacterium]RLB83922.1 MAG: nitroreductase [Deltaproteobacteria bacterium]
MEDAVFTLRGFSLIPLITGLIIFAPFCSLAAGASGISLPAPSHKGTLTVEEALKARRTHRSFKPRSLTLKQFSQILWGAYGVTAKSSGYDLKTAPSAGALYPIDIYAVVGQAGVDTLRPGVYHYCPENHSIECTKERDLRAAVAKHSLRQMWMAKAPVILVITGKYARCCVKYGRRGVTYTHIEAGHVGQNVFLQAEAIGLKAGIVGAFNNEQIIKTLGIPAEHDPLLMMPVGFPD